MLIRTGAGRSTVWPKARQPSGIVAAIIGPIPIPTRIAAAMATRVEASQTMVHCRFLLERAVMVGPHQGHVLSNMMMGNGAAREIGKSARTAHRRLSPQTRTGLRLME